MEHMDKTSQVDTPQVDTPQVRIQGRGVRITKTLHNLIQTKVENAARCFTRIGDLDVRLAKLTNRTRPGNRFKVVIAAKSGWKNMRTVGKGNTIEQAVAAATDHFGTRLRELSDKLSDHRRQRVALKTKQPTPSSTPEDTSTSFKPDGPQAEHSKDIVWENWQGTRKPMTSEDAALVMKEGNLNVMIFTDYYSSELSVMYRRDDGKLGVIVA